MGEIFVVKNLDGRDGASTRSCQQTANCEFYTAEELATYLNRCQKTVYRMRSAGKLPKPIMLGKMPRWRKRDIENWLANGCPSLGLARSSRPR